MRKHIDTAEHTAPTLLVQIHARILTQLTYSPRPRSDDLNKGSCYLEHSLGIHKGSAETWLAQSDKILSISVESAYKNLDSTL